MKVQRNIEAQEALIRAKEQAALRKKERSSGKSEQSQKGAIDASDTVDVSLAKKIAEEDSARAEKIARLKQLIGEGKYNSDSTGVAKAILGHIAEEIAFGKLVNGDS